MNVFEIVKQSVNARQAAEYYGISVKRNGMACCPFHNDKNPSMKIDQRFYCFGCGITGDAIDLVAGMFGIGKYDAAVKLAEDFGLDYERKRQTKRKKMKIENNRIVPKQRLIVESLETKFAQTRNRCKCILSDYLHLLQRWKIIYVPKSMEEDWHPLFYEALQRISYVEYRLDILLFGELEDMTGVIVDYGKRVINLGERIEEFKAGNCRSTEADNGRYGTGKERGRNKTDAGRDTKGWCEEQYKKLPDSISA